MRIVHWEPAWVAIGRVKVAESTEIVLAVAVQEVKFVGFVRIAEEAIVVSQLPKFVGIILIVHLEKLV
jgi:hypothetical protein